MTTGEDSFPVETQPYSGRLGKQKSKQKPKSDGLDASLFSTLSTVCYLLQLTSLFANSQKREQHQRFA